jgi:putative resolvase
MNETRPTARRLLAAPATVTVVAEHRDRPGRVNTAQAVAALAAHGRRLAEMAAGKAAGGLVRDMAGVLIACCARLHGRRPARNQAQKTLRCAARHIGPSHPGAAA